MSRRVLHTKQSTAGQRALLYEEQLYGVNAGYNKAFTIRIWGHTSGERLRASCWQVVAQFPELRTTFDLGGTTKYVHPTAEAFDFDFVSSDRLAMVSVEALTRAEVSTPFRLGMQPPIRFRAFQIGPSQWLVLVVVHHLVFDDRSTEVLFQAFAAALHARQTNTMPDVAAPHQLGDAAAREGGFENAQRFWVEKFGHRSLPLLALPFDSPLGSASTWDGHELRFCLDGQARQRLEGLQAQLGRSKFECLLAVFLALLAKYGNREQVVSLVVTRRSRTERYEVGYYLNTLPLVDVIDLEWSFARVVGDVRAKLRGLYRYRHFPFSKLVEAVRPWHVGRVNGFSQVVFTFMKCDECRIPVGPLELQLERLPGWGAKCPLLIGIRSFPSHDEVRLEYATELFAAATVERIAGHFQNLLAAIAGDPQARLSQLELLSAAERRQLLVEFNATAADYPADRCVHQLVEDQAARSPDATAVICEGVELTYSQLNSRANQLAHHLRGLGVGPETLVGICVERSLEMVVGLLGILKAGGAYVPLDPGYPRERLALMLADTAAPVLVTQQRLLERLPASAVHVVCLDSDRDRIAAHRDENPASGVTADQLAYVIYTSGSTGDPKGVQIEHGALLHYMAAMREAFKLRSGDRVLQFAPINFDTSVEEIFSTLAHGATLVLRPASMLDSVPMFLRQCRELHLTVLDLPTAYWHELAVQSWQGGLAVPECVRLVIIGGEKALAQQLRMWQERTGSRIRTVNTYGPTEATIVATMHELSGCPSAGDSAPEVLIGRPIANTRVYVLDAGLEPVPVGVAGELHIGGSGLARGYLHRPGLTAERFVPDPFADQPGARLYRTGDVCRWRADGQLEFVGRVDDQVKIRGFRVEPGEVEAALVAHPGVGQAVVVARTDTGGGDRGDRRLVAYVVPVGKVPTAFELRAYLRDRLPEWMVPAAFVTLDVLPLTANGKVDRRALPAPQVRADLTAGYAAPRTPTEQALAGVWAEVLGVDRVGIHDNFFDLGGDSILSIQVVARAREAGLHLTPKLLFAQQTIAELAAVASQTPTVAADQGPVTGELPLTPIQRWFFELDSPQPSHFNQSVLLKVDPGLDPALLEPAIRVLVAHHDALRLRFWREDGSWRQRNAELEHEWLFSRVDLSRLEREVQLQALETTAARLQASLDLASGPLLRAALFERGCGLPGRLLVVVHHLAVDRVSWEILLEDLATACNQLEAGQPVRLGPKTTSFRQWAHRLAAFADSDALRQELDHWLDETRWHVHGLPVDHDHKGTNTLGSARAVVGGLSAAETETLLRRVPVAYDTQINDVLLTALAQTLTAWTGQRRVLIDVEGHGREQLFAGVDLTRTVGWFTAKFPVLLELADADDPAGALQSVKAQLRAIPNRGIGYGLLRYLGDAKTAAALAALPQPDINFNYLGQLDRLWTRVDRFTPAREAIGPAQSPHTPREHQLGVTAIVHDGRLQVTWRYSEQKHRRATVEALARQYLDAVRALLASPGAGRAGDQR